MKFLKNPRHWGQSKIGNIGVKHSGQVPNYEFFSKRMRHLNEVYTQASNRRHKRSRHLFQGRYKAILVDKDRYLLELARYVVLNPVRAIGMVRNIEEWQWSSHLAFIGKAKVAGWLTTD